MARKNGSEYFELFIKMSEIAVKINEKLIDILTPFDPDGVEKSLKELHELESSGDSYLHELMPKVLKDFVTPIERDDIIDLARAIDDIIDAVEDVLIKIYMYNIKKLTVEIPEMLLIVGECCQKVSSLVRKFPEFKKPESLHADIIEINRLEEKADALYIKAMHKLYTKDGDPIKTIGYTEVYRQLEKCCDMCENVADVIDSIIVKNT